MVKIFVSTNPVLHPITRATSRDGQSVYLGLLSLFRAIPVLGTASPASDTPSFA